MSDPYLPNTQVCKQKQMSILEQYIYTSSTKNMIYLEYEIFLIDLFLLVKYPFKMMLIDVSCLLTNKKLLGSKNLFSKKCF